MPQLFGIRGPAEESPCWLLYGGTEVQCKEVCRRVSAWVND